MLSSQALGCLAGTFDADGVSLVQGLPDLTQATLDTIAEKSLVAVGEVGIAARSCPTTWCRSGVPDSVGYRGQAARAGMLTVRSSLSGAIVPESCSGHAEPPTQAGDANQPSHTVAGHRVDQGARRDRQQGDLAERAQAGA